MARLEPGNDNENKKVSLEWHVLGGSNKHRIGANAGMAVIEEESPDGTKKTKSYIFDLGVLNGDTKSPEDPSLIDCDTVIADFTPFFTKKDDPFHVPERKVDAIFLTHAHPDHIGAIAYMILMGYQPPQIFATPYTAKRLEQELSNHNIEPADWPEMTLIAPGQPVEDGLTRITAFSVSHSTPQCVGFYIETPAGNIVTPGDFKLDQSLTWGPGFNEEQFKRIVCNGVDLLLLDSTGADRPATPVTEADLRDTLHDIFDENRKKRFVIAVMGGFEENLASVAKVTAETGRTLWVGGFGHEQALSALEMTGLSLADHIGEDLDLRILTGARAIRELAEGNPEDSVVVLTGAQGNPSSELTRAADGKSNKLKLDPKTDVILFCAPSIPGQEAPRERLLANLRNKGFKVLTHKDVNTLYPRAHAGVAELEQFVALAKPKTVLPIHGGEKLRTDCKTLVEKMGGSAIMAGNGDVVKVTKDGAKLKEAPKEKARLIGFKTRTGSHWQTRDFFAVFAPQPKEIEDKEREAVTSKRKSSVHILHRRKS